jgi:hypothetical protein
MVGFGVFLCAGAKSEDELDAIVGLANARAGFGFELRKIPVDGGTLIGCDFLTEDDNFPAVYLERSSASLRRSLEPIMRGFGVEVTAENFRVVVHDLYAH